MTHHRFANWVASPAPALANERGQHMFPGFMAAPIVLLQQPNTQMWHWQSQLYQWAFQQAQAVVERSWIERDVLAVWN